jgi:hypothetical protein
MRVAPLVLRNQKGSALTPDEFDQNLVRLRDFSNALSARIDVVLDSAGQLKSGTVNTGALSDRCVTQPKLDWGFQFFGTATGTNAYAVAFTPSAGFTLGDGAATSFGCYVKFTNANSTAATLDVNGSGAIPIRKFGDNPLIGGEIVAGSIHALFYDGTSFQLIGSMGTLLESADLDTKILAMDVIQISTNDTTTETIAYDGTIPQITEGKEFTTFSYTPVRSDSRVCIEFDTIVGSKSGATVVTVALFQDAVANAAKARAVKLLNDSCSDIRIAHDIPSWGVGVSATFKVRWGDDTADSVTIGRYDLTGTTLGGVMMSTIKITEYLE